MKIPRHHRWDVSPQEAVTIQENIQQCSRVSGIGKRGQESPAP